MAIQYNHDHDNEITLFAETNFRNMKRRFGIKTDDRRRHMYILGKTGMGKTNLLETMVFADIMAGHGLCYIDPHGDTAEKIIDYIPSHRINDVVYFNPGDMAYPVGFNILETVEDDKKHLVASGLMSVFKKIWPDVWSARMEYILMNCVWALLDYPGATLLSINRLLVDQEYRKRVIAKIRDPVVKTFWVAEFTSWSEKYATEAIAPVQNKVGQFLSAAIIRNIVAQVKSTIDPRRVMDEGKILIVNLSKGKIGEDNMRLLGGMMITKLQLAAMERVNIKKEEDRRDFYLYVDEFQNFATESFANILSEARKYRLNLIVAHQYIKQLDEKVSWAVFGNVGTLIFFRVGADDATFMENEFMPAFTPEDLVNLAKYQIYLKLMVDGASTSPFSANTLAMSAQRTGSTEKIIAVSRERYAEPRPIIEDKVLRWSGMELANGQAENVSYPHIMTEEEMSERAEQGTTEKKSDGTLRMSDVREEVEDNEDEATKEFLKISPERLAAITPKPQPGNQPKKAKPMFSHTCTRCGKVWEMPIKLDPSRPMYCAECYPLAQTEQKGRPATPPRFPTRKESAVPSRQLPQPPLSQRGGIEGPSSDGSLVANKPRIVIESKTKSLVEEIQAAVSKPAGSMALPAREARPMPRSEARPASSSHISPPSGGRSEARPDGERKRKRKRKNRNGGPREDGAGRETSRQQEPQRNPEPKHEPAKSPEAFFASDRPKQAPVSVPLASKLPPQSSNPPVLNSPFPIPGVNRPRIVRSDEAQAKPLSPGQKIVFDDSL